MEIITHLDGLALSEDQREAVDRKLSRIEHLERRAIRTRLHIRKDSAHQSQQQFLVKVLIEVPGQDITAEEKAAHPMEALDLLWDKIEHLLLRRKTERLQNRHQPKNQES